MLSSKITLPLGICLLMATPSFAADLVEAAPPPAPAAPTWTIGIEGSPEFYAINNGSNTARSLADTYFKLSVSHSFDNNFVGGVFIQPTFKTGGKTQYYGEASVGYKIKLNDVFTLTPSVAVGYTWHDTGIPKDGDANGQIPYYARCISRVTGSCPSSGPGTCSTCVTAMASAPSGKRRRWPLASPTTSTPPTRCI